MIIISARHFDFKDKDTNKNIKGYTCYAIAETVNPNTIGYEVEKFSLSEEAFVRYDVTRLVKDAVNVAFTYNKYGKVQELHTI